MICEIILKSRNSWLAFWFIYLCFCVLTFCASSWRFWGRFSWSDFISWSIFGCHVPLLTILWFVFVFRNHSVMTAFEFCVMFSRKNTFNILLYWLLPHILNLYLSFFYNWFLSNFFWFIFRFFEGFA